MPIIESSTYQPALFFKNKHINTIYPSLFRVVKEVSYKRTRIDTPDLDFLDLDWSLKEGKALLLVLHGMEGNTHTSFVKGMANAANNTGWDALAMNFRGCSGETNRLYSSYHCGKSDDLALVIEHVVENYRYEQIYLVGFSLGGNLLIKYLGEQADKLNPSIKAAVGISVPTDLGSSARNFKKYSNKIYLNRFLKTLKQKVINKIIAFPDCNLSIDKMQAVKNFKEFDELYTAPAHGFNDAEDYYKSCSSKNFINRVALPTLLINAKDDPFLTPKCYPFKEALESTCLFLETPNYGGHVGFVDNAESGNYVWTEQRAINFLKNCF